MAKYYEYELKAATDQVVRDWLEVKKGEVVGITAASETDERVPESFAASVFSAGGKPLVMYTSSPKGVGKDADKDIPVIAIGNALKHCDAWIELNDTYILYSTAWEIAKENPKLRHVALGGLDVERVARLIGSVDTVGLRPFWQEISRMTKKAHHMRVTTPFGMDIEFDNKPEWPLGCDIGICNVPGTHFMIGQIGWAPDYETVNGTLVFDGALTPPCGLLSEPVKLTVEKGVITKIEGGRQAEQFAKWLESFHHPNMYRIAHLCYGFNPNAKLCGNILEDERIWGCTEWGIGYYTKEEAPPFGIDAPSHTDGICSNSSVWLDGVLIMDKGEIVHPELKKLLP